MKRFISIWIAAALILCGCALAEKTISVKGSGTISLTADTAYVTMGVTLSGEDLSAIQREANQTMDAVCAAMISAGLEEESIATDGICVYPQYDYDQTPEVLVGYRLEETIAIKSTDIDNLGTYIDAAFAAGANTFESITFSASDDTEARRQALQLAVQDATEKAQVIAAAAGEELDGIISITESGTENYYSDYTDGLMRAMSQSSAATTVRAAQISVTANVQIDYQFK